MCFDAQNPFDFLAEADTGPAKDQTEEYDAEPRTNRHIIHGTIFYQKLRTARALRELNPFGDAAGLCGPFIGLIKRADSKHAGAVGLTEAAKHNT
jgi:hypothetical protein